jgi:hypothetical protein
MNTASSGSGRIDDLQSHPQGELRGETKLVKITEDVRKYAAEHSLTNDEAIESGLREKAEEFARSGAEVYAKTLLSRQKPALSEAEGLCRGVPLSGEHTRLGQSHDMGNTLIS